MSSSFVEVAEGFWNIRGSFKIGGVLDVGTQSSLVRRSNGRFLLLDAYTFSASVARQVGELTDGGNEIEAVLHLHPFHTLHVQSIAERYPQATQYGTSRHREKAPGLTWAELGTDNPALHELFADDLEFSVPRGVDFISADENVHFSSVLAYHPASRTIHSDDTLMYLGLPRLARALGMGDSVSFHPTLAKALEPRQGAAEDFRQWAKELFERWKQAENLCAAHTTYLLGSENSGASLYDRMQSALEKAEKTLRAHEEKYA